MGPPGGGRTQITNRAIRHFNVIAYPELDRDTICTLFTTLVNHFFKRFDEDIQGKIDTMINSTLDIYYAVREDLLPTPSKLHYTFNLRDISRVFAGACNIHPKFCPDVTTFVKLWFHENMRVFHDRATCDEDRVYLITKLSDFFPRFGKEKDEILDIERIIFADFLAGRDADPRFYR